VLTIYFHRRQLFQIFHPEQTQEDCIMSKTSRETQRFSKGQAIITEGTLGDCTFRILSGEAQVCKYDRHGVLVPFAKLASGDFVGEMYLFEPNLQRSASVIVSSDEIVLEIYQDDEMRELLQGLDSTVGSLLCGMSDRVKSTSEHFVKVRPEHKTESTSILSDGIID
jgi:CRP-like cAMP-binding protein